MARARSFANPEASASCRAASTKPATGISANGRSCRPRPVRAARRACAERHQGRGSDTWPTEQKKADVSSRHDLHYNDDGSVDVYIGPNAPDGKESNWIPTVDGKAWFPYFRLYSPTQPFLEHTWILPDIQKAS